MLEKYKVSAEAQVDLREIARYTHEKWGKVQAIQYVRKLHECFQSLAEYPGMGRACDSVSSGLHRHEQGRHTIYYRLIAKDIRIVRVLHQQMLPAPKRFE